MRTLIFLFCLPLFALSQSNLPQHLDQYMRAQLSVKGFTGSVLVMKENKVLLRRGYGQADREWNITNTPDTKFELGSLTKQFTATSILLLEEQGKLSTSDHLNKYIPGFPKADSVTLDMLLHHTSGIANYTAFPGFWNIARLSLSKDSMVAIISKVKYDFTPGTKYSYSNSGYFLLGYIIEKITGAPLETYFRNNIFDKIGMHATGINRWDTILPMRAHGYQADKKKITNALFISMEWPFSAGALYSTVEDLYKWDRALYNNSILSEASRKKLFTPAKNDYACGFIIDSLEKHPRIWHNGSIPGFNTHFARFIQDDLCIIVLSNTSIIQNNTLPATDVIADGLAKIVFGLPVETPYEHKEVTIDPLLLDKYVGKYSAGLTIEVIKKDQKLYRHRNGIPDIELKPESATKFFYADDSDRQLEFELDNTGNIVKIWFINNEQRGEMKKL